MYRMGAFFCVKLEPDGAAALVPHPPVSPGLSGRNVHTACAAGRSPQGILRDHLGMVGCFYTAVLIFGFRNLCVCSITYSARCCPGRSRRHGSGSRRLSSAKSGPAPCNHPVFAVKGQPGCLPGFALLLVQPFLFLFGADLLFKGVEPVQIG